MQTTVDTTVQCRWRMTLNRSDLVEMVRALHPDANVPVNADVDHCQESVDDDEPIVITWTTTQTTHA